MMCFKAKRADYNNQIELSNVEGVGEVNLLNSDRRLSLNDSGLDISINNNHTVDELRGAFSEASEGENLRVSDILISDMELKIS